MQNHKTKRNFEPNYEDERLIDMDKDVLDFNGYGGASLYITD